MRTRHAIQQFRLDDWDTVKLWYLDKFALECGSKLEPAFPIFAVLVDGQLAAYYYASPHVCIRPTVHPTFSSPRAFYETARNVIAATKRDFTNPLWLMDPKSRLANAALLAKLGLSHSDLSVYEVS